MKIAVLPGDGIGPEIVAVTLEVLKVLDDHFGLGLEFEFHDIGLKTLASLGTTFPAAVLKSCRAAEGIILGPVSHQDYPARPAGGINPSGELRIKLDLYANIRPSRSRASL